jgi:hypothetical protein
MLSDSIFDIHCCTHVQPKHPVMLFIIDDVQVDSMIQHGTIGIGTQPFLIILADPQMYGEVSKGKGKDSLGSNCAKSIYPILVWGLNLYSRFRPR